MRTQILTFASAYLLSISVASAAKVGSVNLIVSPMIQGKLTAQLELQKGLFKKTFDTLDLKKLEVGQNQIALKKQVDVKDIKVTFTLESETNLENKKEVAIIKGSISPGKEFKDGEAEVVDEKSMKADISCSNVIKSSLKGDQLIIDTSAFKNLSDCGGKDISLYSANYVGKRKVDDGANWFSMADDERMGREYAEQFIAENSSTVLPKDHPTTIYMQEKMDIIAKNSDMPNLRPKVRVINADVLNAFALPGGYVFVFRGLMEKSPSEAALLGVLGHEWAHVTARHGTRGMTRALKTMTIAVSVALVAQVWAEVTDDKVKKIVLPLIGAGTVIGAQLKLLSKGRDQEMEADRLGSQYAVLSGYHPRGIGDMFETFKRESGGGGSTSLEKILSSHPDHDTRIGRNHVYSALFFQGRPDYISTSVGYEHALAALTGEALPPQSQSVQLASAFINGLQKQQEDVVTEYMKGYIETIMKAKKPKEEVAK